VEYVDCVSTFCTCLLKIIMSVLIRFPAETFIKRNSLMNTVLVIVPVSFLTMLCAKESQFSDVVLLESGSSTCYVASITRSLRWKFIRRWTIIESDGPVWQSQLAETRKKMKGSSAWTPFCTRGLDHFVLEKSLARQKRRPWRDAFSTESI